MQILQRIFLLPPKTGYLRQYVKKVKPTMAKGRMVHQEMLRYVSPYAQVFVKSDILVRVKPADVHQYTSGDVIKAQLLGVSKKNCSATLDITVSECNKVVNVLVKDASTDVLPFECNLNIPIRAELYINTAASAHVEGIQSEAIQIKAGGDIYTKNVRATNISLTSPSHIICEGTLLGKCTTIETEHGNIVLEKLQGDSLTCNSKSGPINTSCCYVENSIFNTETGRLDLKNVHKSCKVYLNKEGELNMTGVHGNINVVAKGGSVNLQLSELIGKSQIVAFNLKKEALINISDSIEHNMNIDVNASEIHLDNNIAERLSHALSKDKQQFKLSNINQEHHLLIQSTGDKGVRLGNKSWSDIIRQSINVVDS